MKIASVEIDGKTYIDVKDLILCLKNEAKRKENTQYNNTTNRIIVDTINGIIVALATMH